ncbi:MAG TPA: hypothetical protein VJY39_09845 [Acidisphaera sp.]|nr:hypothetical protein [Acidisphaera sp.]
MAEAQTLGMAARTIARMGDELRRLATGLAAIENAVSELVASQPHVSDQHVKALQSFDLVGQGITSIADTMAALARHLPSEVRLDLAAITESLVMADLAARLRDDRTESHAEPRAEPVLFR